MMDGRAGERVRETEEGEVPEMKCVRLRVPKPVDPR